MTVERRMERPWDATPYNGMMDKPVVVAVGTWADGKIDDAI